MPLIGLDWGSSHVRAFAFDNKGDVIATRRSDRGASKLRGANEFEAALDSLIGDWAREHSRAELIACGMVGARGAWVEAGYVSVDANAATLKRARTAIATTLGREVSVIPGVKSNEPDVMRGEETQIMGTDATEGVIVLPGTHSKWVRLASKRIMAFKTCFTGEINALLRESSSIGKVLSSAPSLNHVEAIERGIARARESAAWLHELFSFRARVVTNATGEAHASSELSAWLIASELRQMLESEFASSDITIVASAELAPWYQRIAESFGVECDVLDGDACVARGLWRIANAT
jgi:2-dehydro-3-deoxygalactonokinase